MRSVVLWLAAVALVACSKKPDTAGASPVAASAAAAAQPVASAPAPKVLLPAYASAKECLARCVSEWWGPRRPGAEDPAPKFTPELPQRFAEFLVDPEEHARFVGLIERLPAHLHPIGKLQPGDEPETVNNGVFGSYQRERPKMYGDLYSVLTDGSRAVYIYSNVYYFRTAGKSSGHMHFAIDPATHEVAGLVRAGANLDEYYVAGSESLRGPLLAFTIAKDLDTARMLAHYARKQPGAFESDPIILPLNKSLDEAILRVELLNDRLGDSGQATGVPAPEFLQEARAAQAEAAWYAVAQGRDQCVISPMSPAERIDLVKSARVVPTVRDTMAADGKLASVEVSSQDGGYERTWRFFKRKADCERTLTSSVPTPGKYR